MRLSSSFVCPTLLATAMLGVGGLISVEASYQGKRGGAVSGGRRGHGGGPGDFPVPNGCFTPVIAPMPFIFMAPIAPYGPPMNGGGYFYGGFSNFGPDRGLMLPNPAAPVANNVPQPAPQPVVRRPAPAKRTELVTFGDRLFRAKNLKRAEERYISAAKADPNSAAPYIRLALIELERGNYAQAADRIRSAQTAEPGWLVQADDIQTVYSEPADFAKILTKLETHLQGHPNDRDAWLALGAELYLSGRTKRAHDIFLRLADRKVDETVAAFLDASAPTETVRVEPSETK